MLGDTPVWQAAFGGFINDTVAIIVQAIRQLLSRDTTNAATLNAACLLLTGLRKTPLLAIILVEVATALYRDSSSLDATQSSLCALILTENLAVAIRAALSLRTGDRPAPLQAVILIKVATAQQTSRITAALL